jgi:hypothetical protein
MKHSTIHSPALVYRGYVPLQMAILTNPVEGLAAFLEPVASTTASGP